MISKSCEPVFLANLLHMNISINNYSCQPYQHNLPAYNSTINKLGNIPLSTTNDNKEFDVISLLSIVVIVSKLYIKNTYNNFAIKQSRKVLHYEKKAF